MSKTKVNISSCQPRTPTCIVQPAPSSFDIHKFWFMLIFHECWYQLFYRCYVPISYVLIVLPLHVPIFRALIYLQLLAIPCYLKFMVILWNLPYLSRFHFYYYG